MAFPSNPVNGQSYASNGAVYVYQSTKNAWIKNNYTGVTLNANSLILTSNVESGSTTSGAHVVNGGAGIVGRLNVGGSVVLSNSTTSTSTTTGALVVAGGAGIAGNIVVGDSIISAVNSGFGSVSNRFTANIGTKADFHITTNINGASATATQQYGITFAIPGGNTQAAILISENGSDGTAFGFFATDNYASGPQLRAQILPQGHLCPGATNSFDLGTTALRWRNVFTQDLHLSNGIGNYTIVEGEDDLFLYNNRTGKTYKFLIQEVDPSIVPPKKG